MVGPPPLWLPNTVGENPGTWRHHIVKFQKEILKTSERKGLEMWVKDLK